MNHGSPQPNVGPRAWHRFGWRFWLAVVAAGAGAGLAAGVLMRLLAAVQRLAWGEGTGDFADAVLRDPAWRRVLVLAGAGLVAGLAGWGLSLRKGGHGAELTEAIWFRAGGLPPLRTLGNALVSIVIVGMGASLGREAAPKQTGAVWAGLLARWAGLPPAQRRLLVACGAGAGIGAVYDVPLGAALFALEVLLGSLSLVLVAPAMLASLVGVGAAWLILGQRVTYAVPAYGASPGLFAGAAVLGPVLGLGAVAYVRLISWADARKPKGVRRLLAPVVALGAVGVAAVWLPAILGNGRDLAQAAFAGSGPGLAMLAVLALAKPLATACCLGSGAPGGLFTPTIATGAVAGLLAGKLAVLAGLGGAPGAYALMGAGAMLAAASQAPVSAVVLMLELTRRLDAMMAPLLLAVALAVLVARALERRSTYTFRIHAGQEAAAGALSTAARYPDVTEALTTADQVRVVDEAGAEIGRLDRAALRGAAARCGPLEIATARDLVLPPAMARLPSGRPWCAPPAGAG